MTTDVATQREQPALRTYSDAIICMKIAVVLGLMWVLFWHVLVEMAKDWWNFDAYSQGMLLPPLAAYVAWLNRERTLAIAASSDHRGLLLTGFACLMYVVGQISS